MEFTVLERLVAIDLLPREGNYTDLKLIRQARENLSFTNEENEALNFREVDRRTMWDEGVPAKEIDLGSVVTKKLRSILETLNNEGKLKEEQMSLFEKFCDPD